MLSEDNINARTQFNMPRSEVIENKSTYKTLDRYNSARFLKYPHPPHNLERHLTKYLRDVLKIYIEASSVPNPNFKCSYYSILI